MLNTNMQCNKKLPFSSSNVTGSTAEPTTEAAEALGLADTLLPTDAAATMYNQDISIT